MVAVKVRLLIEVLLIILLIVGVFAQETEMSDLEKQLLYKQNDRSPLLAGLCALTPTMGHLYMGEWTRGFKPLISKLFLISFFIYGSFEAFDGGINKK